MLARRSPLVANSCSSASPPMARHQYVEPPL